MKSDVPCGAAYTTNDNNVISSFSAINLGELLNILPSTLTLELTNYLTVAKDFQFL